MSPLHDYTATALAPLEDQQVKDEYANQLGWLAANAQLVGLVGVEMSKLAALEVEVSRRANLKARTA